MVLESASPRTSFAERPFLMTRAERYSPFGVVTFSTAAAHRRRTLRREAVRLQRTARSAAAPDLDVGSPTGLAVLPGFRAINRGHQCQARPISPAASGGIALLPKARRFRTERT